MPNYTCMFLKNEKKRKKKKESIGTAIFRLKREKIQTPKSFLQVIIHRRFTSNRW